MNDLFDIKGALYASVTVCDVTFYDLVCGNPVIHFDTLKMSNLEGTAEATDITGGQGNAVLASINHTKALNLSMEDALVSMSYLAVITGGTVVKSDANTKISIVANEEVVATEDGIKLTHTMPGGTVLWLAEVNDRGEISERKARFDAPAGTDIQDIELTDVNWKPSTYKLEEGKTYRVFYNYELGENTNARELTVFADKFSKSFRMVGDTTLYNRKTGKNEACQIEIPILKLDDNYTLTFDASGEAATFALNGKALADDKRRLLIVRIYNEDGTVDGEECLLPVASI